MATENNGLFPGVAVEGKPGELGVITDAHYTRGKVKTLVSCGVMWIGSNYAVRELAENLTPVTLGKVN